MKHMILATVVTTFVLTASAQADDTPKPHLDRDGDHKVSSAEAEHARLAAFDRLDANRDDVLTRDEFKKPPAAGIRANVVRDLAAEQIKRMDADRDGRISKVEYTTAGEKRFERVDGNKDGYIDTAERDALREIKRKKAAELREHRKHRAISPSK